MFNNFILEGFRVANITILYPYYYLYDFNQVFARTFFLKIKTNNFTPTVVKNNL